MLVNDYLKAMNRMRKTQGGGGRFPWDWPQFQLIKSSFFFFNAMFVLIIYLHFITEHLFSWKHNFLLPPFHSTCQTLFLTYSVSLVFHYNLEKVVTERHEGAINFSTRWSQCQQVSVGSVTKLAELLTIWETTTDETLTHTAHTFTVLRRSSVFGRGNNLRFISTVQTFHFHKMQ